MEPCRPACPSHLRVGSMTAVSSSRVLPMETAASEPWGPCTAGVLVCVNCSNLDNYEQGGC